MISSIPIFLSRSFRHAAVFTRNDANILKPSDLKGKTLGVTEYQLTANVWVRGILEDYYDVPQIDIRWIRGGLFDPKRPEKIKVKLPDGLDYREAPEGSTLNDLMEAGQIEGLIGPRPPKNFYQNQNYGRLFSDTYGAVSEYYQNTQIFPIMHVIRNIYNTLVLINISANTLFHFLSLQVAVQSVLHKVLARSNF